MSKQINHNRRLIALFVFYYGIDAAQSLSKLSPSTLVYMIEVARKENIRNNIISNIEAESIKNQKTKEKAQKQYRKTLKEYEV